MDLVTLDDTTRSVKRTVEEWSSLIWTERYNTLGEFELKSSNIDYHIDLLPRGSYVGIRQSEQPMKVENHLIEIDEQNNQILTVSGRAMECVLEDRTNGPVLTALGSGNNSGFPVVATNMLTYIVRTLQIHISDVANIIPLALCLYPDLTIQAEFSVVGTPNYTIPDEITDLLTRTLTSLKQANYGMRGIRPKGAATGFIISIYNGVDKTSTVIFRTAQGHIRPTSYLFSTKNHKNVGYISTVNGADRFNAPGDAVTHTGWDRRELTINGSDITAASGTGLNSMMKLRTQTELLKNPETATFGFELLSLSPYIYGDDYFLGDLVRVEADYGLSQDMQVTEFIRSEDTTGYREFPTLAQYVPVEYV